MPRTLTLARIKTTPCTEGHRAAKRHSGARPAHIPFAGSRMVPGLLAEEAFKVRQLRVATMMKGMGVKADCLWPNTSKPEPGHKICPYLAGNLPITWPNQVCALISEPGNTLRPHSSHDRNTPDPACFYQPIPEAVAVYSRREPTISVPNPTQLPQIAGCTRIRSDGDDVPPTSQKGHQDRTRQSRRRGCQWCRAGGSTGKPAI